MFGFLLINDKNKGGEESFSISFLKKKVSHVYILEIKKK